MASRRPQPHAVLGFDTTGDGRLDAFETNQDGVFDTRASPPAGGAILEPVPQLARGGGSYLAPALSGGDELPRTSSGKKPRRAPRSVRPLPPPPQANLFSTSATLSAVCCSLDLAAPTGAWTARHVAHAARCSWHC